MEAFKSRTANGIIFNKPKGKQKTYFVANSNNKSWIINNKSPIKLKTVTSPEMTSHSTPDELSIIGNSMLTKKTTKCNSNSCNT